jgi:hypothetical protein
MAGVPGVVGVPGGAAVGMGARVPFQVAFVSAEDPSYPASELNTHSANTRGWQSPRCVRPR